MDKTQAQTAVTALKKQATDLEGAAIGIKHDHPKVGEHLEKACHEILKAADALQNEVDKL